MDGCREGINVDALMDGCRKGINVDGLMDGLRSAMDGCGRRRLLGVVLNAGVLKRSCAVLSGCLYIIREVVLNTNCSIEISAKLSAKVISICI